MPESMHKHTQLHLAGVLPEPEVYTGKAPAVEETIKNVTIHQLLNSDKGLLFLGTGGVTATRSGGFVTTKEL